METVKFSIDVIANYIEDDDYEFGTARFEFLSDGENSHGYDISNEILKRDAHTILGKFIVGKYNKFKEDFMGHQSDEVILGYIPKDSKLSFVERENGTFICVDGVISKLYATDAYEAFKKENGRSVSVEMGVCFENPDDLKSPVTHINYTAITILGLDVSPSCKGANVKMIKFSAQDAEDYYTKHQESTLVKFARERKEKIDKGSDNVKIEKAKFAANLDMLWCNIYSILEQKYPDKDYGSIYRIDGIFEEDGNKFVILNRKDEQTKYKLNFTCDGDSICTEDEMVEVEQVYIEKETIVKFEEPEADIEKFKCFSADENVDAGAKEKDLEDDAEANKEKAEKLEENIIMEEEKSNEEEPDELAKCQAELASCKAELEECKGKLAECETKFETQNAEFAKLQEFKTQEETKAKKFAVDSALSEVKGFVKSAQFEELQKEGMACEMAELDSFITKVKAVGFEAMKGKKKSTKEGLWSTAFADENIEKKSNGLWD